MNTQVSLYKADSKGKLRVLTMWTEGARLLQDAGLVGGRHVRQEKVCLGKNIGRENETSPAEQAKLEMTSKLNKKIDEGYFYTEKEALSTKVLLPMLAKDYKKEARKIQWASNVFVQPKLDGMRCLAVVENKSCTLISRQGKTITTMDHIVGELALNINETIILDGELYVHGESFQENMKLIKKYRQGMSEEIKYCAYDIVDENAPFATRKQKLEAVLTGLQTVVIVQTESIDSELALQEFHKQALGDGFEGTILRHGIDGYELDKRSSSLLKYKDFIDLAVTLVDVIPAEARPAWGTPCFELKGKEFRASCRLSHAEREDLLSNKHKYIGQTAELRFFEYSDEGIPRFPVLVGFRLDK